VIVVVGLSPAWQQVVVVDELLPGEVHRAREVHWCAAGKVFNVAISVVSLGGDVRAVSVLGGATGESIRNEMRERGIEGRWIDSSAATRVCTTVVDASRGVATELVENAPEVSATQLAAFQVAVREEASGADFVVLTGSLARGAPPSYFRELVDGFDARAILDVRGPELLEALEARPFLVKPNREELAKTLGRSLEDESALLDAARELCERGAGWSVVTDGARDAIVIGDGEAWRLTPPRVAAVNPVGCGDAMTGAIAQGLDDGLEPIDAVRLGMAAAANNLEQLSMGRLDRRRVAEYSRHIEARHMDLG
jgi:1-phosphofructokinase family hexose kinase